MSNRCIATFAGVMLLSVAAWATDHEQEALKLLVKQKTANGKAKMVWVSTSPPLALPALPPTGVGARIVLTGTNQIGTADLGAGTWTANAAGTLYKYVNTDAPQGDSVCKVALVKDAKILKVVCKGSLIDLDDAAQGTLSITLVVGDDVYCSTCDAPLKDAGGPDGGMFKAKRCSAPAACSCFRDLGDGTIQDICTGLQWEKKTTAVGSGANPGDLHDVDNLYVWGGCCSGICNNSPSSYCQPTAAESATCAALSDGGTVACSTCASGTCVLNALGGSPITTVWDWLTQLNASNFAGHSDWRLPSELGCNAPGVWSPPDYTCAASEPHELETILLQPYACGTSPCIDPIFGPTASNRYWSSSFSVPYAVQEWAVEFLNGAVGHLPPAYDVSVRAVRSGS